MPVFDEPVPEPDVELVPLEPDVPLPLVPAEPGLPDVPVSPLLDVPPVAPVPPALELLPDMPEPLEPVPPMLPEVEPEADEGELDEALLPGVVSLLLLELLDGVVLEVVDGVVDEPDAPVDPLPEWDLSQPVTAAPAKARTATTGMSFFMTSPISV